MPTRRNLKISKRKTKNTKNKTASLARKNKKRSTRKIRGGILSIFKSQWKGGPRQNGDLYMHVIKDAISFTKNATSATEATAATSATSATAATAATSATSATEATAATSATEATEATEVKKALKIQISSHAFKHLDALVDASVIMDLYDSITVSTTDDSFIIPNMSDWFNLIGGLVKKMKLSNIDFLRNFTVRKFDIGEPVGEITKGNITLWFKDYSEPRGYPQVRLISIFKSAPGKSQTGEDERVHDDLRESQPNPEAKAERIRQAALFEESLREQRKTKTEKATRLAAGLERDTLNKEKAVAQAKERRDLLDQQAVAQKAAPEEPPSKEAAASDSTGSPCKETKDGKQLESLAKDFLKKIKKNKTKGIDPVNGFDSNELETIKDLNLNGDKYKDCKHTKALLDYIAREDVFIYGGNHRFPPSFFLIKS